jgi:cytochrome c-type biogenesis protein CcmH/NrfG
MLYGSWSRRAVSLVLVPFLLLLAYGCKGDPQAKKAAHRQKGEAYVAQEKYPEAIIEFRNAIKADPKDAQPYYKLALVYLKQGEAQLPNAFRALQKKEKARA